MKALRQLRPFIWLFVHSAGVLALFVAVTALPWLPGEVTAIALAIAVAALYVALLQMHRSVKRLRGAVIKSQRQLREIRKKQGGRTARTKIEGSQPLPGEAPVSRSSSRSGAKPSPGEGPADVPAEREGSRGRDIPRLPSGPIGRPDITAAVILDPFSELAFKYEWHQIALTPENWADEIRLAEPDLLFIESAWQGNNGKWRLAMTAKRGVSQNLIDLIDYCRLNRIPTVFWNKEDPPNYDRFIDTARLVDYVFTVDAEMIPKYRRDLGHDRISLLPFAAQPRIHNPIQYDAGRTRPLAFAGTYFAERHDQRREQMDYILGPAREFGLEIYSRMASEDGRYHFPEDYQSNIVGSLPYEQMLQAYKQYQVFLNVNTVTESPSMCSRRLFELSAAATPVLSGPARSIENFFGHDVLVSNSETMTRESLAALLQHEEYRDRLGLRAHRRVMRDHTYGKRVSTVLSTIGAPSVSTDRSVSMIVPTRRPDMLENVLAFASAQTPRDKELVLVTHGFEVQEAELRARLVDSGLADLTVVPAGKELSLGACMNLGLLAASGRYVAKMDDDNVYSEHYLEDLLYAFEYTNATVVGKWAHYVHLGSTDATVLRFPYAEHRYVRLVQGGTLTVAREVASELLFEDLPRRVDTTFLEKVRAEGGKVYSADRFNFVSRRQADPAGHTWKISDRELMAKKSRLAFYGDPTQHVTV